MTDELPDASETLVSDSAQKSLIFDTKKVELNAGKKYSFCTCGKSKALPYCDDEHKKINEKLKTSYKSLKIIPKQDIELEVYCSNWQE